MSLTPYSDLFLRILDDYGFIQVLMFLIMQVPNQSQSQQVATQAIAQVDNVPSSANLAFVRDPIFWTILALAVLIRVILERPSSNKK